MDRRGRRQSLLAANLSWLEARGLDGFVAEGAELARGVRLEQSLVGAGARVSGQGTAHALRGLPGRDGAGAAH